MSKIYDNAAGRKFEDGLRAILQAPGVKRADFCVGYFNLRGWGSVANEIAKLEGADVYEKQRTSSGEHLVGVHRVCRLLVGMHRPPADLIRELYQSNQPIVDSEKVQRWKRSVAVDFRKQLTLGVPTIKDEEALLKLRSQLANGKVMVKLHLRYPLHAKLYLAHRPNDPTPILSLMGSSNLTFGGMTRNGELNAEFADVDDTKKYDQWFNERWNDFFSIDITRELIDVLDQSWASEKHFTPYEVYLKIMYQLSREARQGVSEYHLPAPFDTELFEFQQTAVKMAVRHLEKRGGAMIGDVVGLGKTITACAVAKFYEEIRGASTLVLCPPKLVEMWQDYAKHYDLKMMVRSVAKDFDVATERHFHLVIIDESQNLRNDEGKRYSLIKDLLSYQNNKVLLLTATPYNKDFSDLANQLKLFLDPDIDLGIRPEAYIAELGGEHAFATQHPNTPISSIQAFEKSICTDDWRDLMKLYLVRRTRTFIKRNYAKLDEEKGRYYLEFKDGTRNYFPERKPLTIKFKTTAGDQFERLYSDAMIDLMADLRLPRYGLQKFIDEAIIPTADKREAQIIDNLSRAGKRLMGFTRSNFYKRMDSSGVAFLMSLYRYAVRNEMFIYALKAGLDIPIRVDTELDDGYSTFDDGGEDTSFEFTTDERDYAVAGKKAYEQIKWEAGPKVKWISPRFFKKSLATELRRDNNKILEMLKICGVWKPGEDAKLDDLYTLVAKKHKDEKILVFTQYADTARYVAEQLEARGVARVVQVDGDTEDVQGKVKRFSPKSNHATEEVTPADEYRIMVATDMLSEGQNLQDAHIVINYDLPWAIIRLIQRAGRVDRIGQKAENVFCYSFFPQEGINNIIRLRDRLNRRINENADVVGSDEIFFEGNEKNLTDLFNEKAGALDETDDGEVDLSSQAYQIWESATKDDKKLAERIKSLADVIYSTKPETTFGEGVITYARTRSEADVLVWLDNNGKVKSTSPIKVFQALACTAATPRVNPLKNHHQLVAKALDSIKTTGNVAMGVLGSKTSTKYRIFAMLETRLKENLMPLFEQGLKETLDEIYNYPMKDYAKTVLGKMLQQHHSADEILETVLNLHHDGELCIVPDEQDDSNVHEPRIICSLGMAKERA